MMSIDNFVSVFSHPILQLIETIPFLVAIIISVGVNLIICKTVLSVWWRLGKSLAKRKIAVIAEANDYNDLECMLVDSKLFNRKNIHHIGTNSIQSAESMSLLLIHWKSCCDHINTILNIKSDTTMLVIYAPQNEGMIDKRILQEINTHRNVVITNFRGRLLNDVFACMITSSD